MPPRPPPCDAAADGVLSTSAGAATQVVGESDVHRALVDIVTDLRRMLDDVRRERDELRAELHALRGVADLNAERKRRAPKK